MSTVDVLVYEPDGTTPMAVVPDVLSVTASEESTGPGGGTLEIAHDNPALVGNRNLLNPRNVVKVRVDGVVRAAWFITQTTKVMVGDSEADQVWTVSGPGLLAWLDDAVVHQEYENPYSDSTRYFGWGSGPGSWYREDSWGRPVRVAKRGGNDWTDPNNRYRKKPVNWPNTGDTTAWWVWDRSNANRAAPKGWCYFRYKLDVSGTDIPHTLYLTADNRVDVQLDGEPLATVRGRRAFKRTYAVDFDLSAGTHYLGFRAKNRGAGASLIAALFRYADADDAEEDGILVTATGHNSSRWRLLAYPSQEPGWTAGEVLAKIVAEANERGVGSIGYLNGDNFSATVDSDGVAWPEYCWKFGVGDTYSAVVAEMRDYDVDVRVNPNTLKLEAYDTRGTSVSGVVLDSGVNITGANQSVESKFANTILFNDEDEWRTIGDSASVLLSGRTEAYLALGSLPSRSATKVVNKTLEQYGLPIESVVADYVPTGNGDVPWQDFNVGDTIYAPDSGGGGANRRVLSISVAIDDSTGEPVYSVELDALSSEVRDRIQRLINRLSAGGGGNLAGKVPSRRGKTPGANDPGSGGGGGGGGSPSGGGAGGNPYRPADPVFEPPTDDPWTRPDDPIDPGDGYGQEWGVGQVSKAVAEDMIAVWSSEYGDPLKLALLTAEPSVADGVWDIAGVECTEADYARVDVALSAFDAATGNDPVYRATNVELTFPTNASGGDWAAVTHMALLDTAGADVLSVIALPEPIVVGDSESASVGSGNLQLVVESV